MTDRELMQQALDALETICGLKSTNLDIPTAMQALRARLAQPEQEPSNWVVDEWNLTMSWMLALPMAVGTKLYTFPPQREWQGLTDEEIMDACSAVWASHPIEVGQVVAAILKEKNGF